MTDRSPPLGGRAPGTETRKTLLWWTVLRAIAAGNGLAWLATAALVDRSDPAVRVQLGLSAVYVLVCAFRSVLPRIDLERTCLVDTPWSSMALGRSAATVAEVCFAAQVGMVVAMMGAAAGLPWVEVLGTVVVVVLAVAQLFCWASVISLSHLGHAIEESLWAAAFLMVGLAAAACVGQLEGTLATLARVAVPVCAVYVAFMVLVDVPMYLRRWRQGRADGVQTLGFREGMRDALHRRHATQAWSVWRPEVAWLTGYFSLAVWGSLALVHVVSAV